MFIKRHGNAGLTLIEFLVTSTIGLLLVGVVVGMWYFAYKNWTIERVRSNLRNDLEIVVERIKEEVRLSSTTYISGYPLDATTYNAISFPLATLDGDGFYVLDEEGFIQWDKSVIYHAYENSVTGNTELRKTVFTDNASILTKTLKREKQLVSVAETGNGLSAENSENAVTTIIIPRSEKEAEIVDVGFSVAPTDQGFDGYSPVNERTNVSFGNINLTPGFHELQFKVTGKNEDSTGYKFGIDTLSITPAGCAREPEVYIGNDALIDTILDSSGDTIAKIGPDDVWSGRNFLEYNSNAKNDYLVFKFNYDLWRESNFDNSRCVNIVLTGDDLYVELSDINEGSEIGWQAESETGAAQADYNDEGGLPITMADQSVRCFINTANITAEGDLIRVKFASHSTQPLTITCAYLDVKDSAGGDTPTLKYNPSVPEELFDYKRTHVQLFFENPITGVSESSVTIDPNDVLNPRFDAYSNWAIYPLLQSESYFVTFHVSSDPNYANASYWPCVLAEMNSYMITGESYVLDVAWPDAGEPAYTSSPNTYVTAVVDVWESSGTITTDICDSGMDSPSYGSLLWTENVPSNSAVTVQARTSNDQNMLDAPAWEDVDDERYIQFFANLTLTPTWKSRTNPSIEVSDFDYKQNNQTIDPDGEPLIPNVCVESDCYPWVDNITIDWDGQERICEISGYFIKNPDYGTISLLVDGEPLTKNWNFDVSVKQRVGNKIYEASVTAVVEPRNTGK